MVVSACTLGCWACSSAPPGDAASGEEATSSSVVANASGPPAGYCEVPGYYFVQEGIVRVGPSDTGEMEWQRAVPAASFTYEQAVNYCETLILQGDAWHLPRAADLRALLVHPLSQEGSPELACVPSIDQVAFPDTPAADFWTAEPEQDQRESTSVSFYDGESHLVSFDTPLLVRCIRDSRDVT
jgi:hypothetical protein